MSVGSADLDSNVLVDGLNTVIAELRRSLHPAMGVRAYTTSTVLRTWSGRSIGDGSYEDTVTELDPQPRVMPWDNVGQLRYDLEACGLSATGDIILTEVNLEYIFDELAGPALDMNQQWLIKIGEAHGQRQPDRYYTLAKPPFVDREKDMGWVMFLRHVGAGR